MRIRTPYYFLLLIVQIVILFGIQVYPQSDKIFFESQGFTKTRVTKVIQDEKGYLWISTWGGIMRYDGYNFISYYNIPGDTNSFVDAFAETMCEDKAGYMWVGTFRGLEKFDRNTGIFTHYMSQTTGSGAELSNHVLSILEDKFGILWIGTMDGLNIFDRKTGKFKCLRHDSSDAGSIINNTINTITEDKEGNLWIGTGGGLDKLDRKTGKFVHYWNDPGTIWINTIYEEIPGRLWLGTHGGLVDLNIVNGKSIKYFHNPNDTKSISENDIYCLCPDPSGALWVGTSNGLNSFNKTSGEFTRYLPNEKDPGSLISGTINSIFWERSGTIWIGTFSGLTKINRVKQPFTKYDHTNIISDIFEHDGMVLVNSVKGWDKFDPKTEQFSPFKHGGGYLVGITEPGDIWGTTPEGGIYKRDSHGIVTNYYLPSPGGIPLWITCVYKTRDGNIWIGTENEGVYYINPSTNLVTLVKKFKVSINYLFEDTYGSLWIGTVTGGLFCCNEADRTIKGYSSNQKGYNSIAGTTMLDAFEDKKGILWFGSNKGLNKFDRSTGKFTLIEQEGGAVFSIFQDGHGLLWLSTGIDIVAYNPETNHSQNYDVSYGLPSNGFSDIRGCKTKNGEMYFGGNGLIRFHPDSIRNNTFIPPIQITSFRKFDKPVSFGKENNLKYNDNFISFEFAALSFISPERNQYAYKLEGLDKDWIYSGNRRFASYPNLDPGKYIFRVKGSNNDGIWNEAGTSIIIIISPPWWKTLWAYLSYFGLFVFGLYLLRRYELNRISLRNRLRVNDVILKEKEESEKMKSTFFANISHEFRTPLTLIKGPVENIIKKSIDEKILKDAHLIKRNSARLLQLINQLLDLSKLEVHKLNLEASEGNIVSFVKGIALSFESLFESKDIALKFRSDKQAIDLYFDSEKMMKVITNIISNAFKFTPEGGKITITVHKIENNGKSGQVQIIIHDTGIGIQQEEIPKLFDRFYQVDSSFTKEYEGAGIGLALTKELVELHKGKISVASKPVDLNSGIEGWTEFIVELPLGRVHLKDEEIKDSRGDNGKSKIQLDEEDYLYTDKTVEESVNDSVTDKNIILIVEDNYDMREFIKDSLMEDYIIEEAVNGEQGVRKAEAIIPDLIISDVMMPKMDGNELVRYIKNNEKTSHIPVILLTARSAQNDKIGGLESGADEYLSKPFDIKELQVRIKNLITIRKKMQAKFSKMESSFPDSNVSTTQKILSGIDEKFMSKVTEIIDKHISEEEFSIEEFGNELGMSRMQVHRKLKALTGKSASRFIRTIKLERGRKFIEEKKGNISEIAYSLGFASPSYFTRCFREEFGYPPTEIINS